VKPPVFSLSGRYLMYCWRLWLQDSMATYFSAAAGLQLSGWFWMMMWCNYQSWCCAVLDTNLKITGWRTSFLNYLIDTGSPELSFTMARWICG
jgi:hypothetical protein